MSNMITILGLGALFVIAFLFFFVVIQVALAMADVQKKPR